jgi:hypothetical protein
MSHAGSFDTFTPPAWAFVVEGNFQWLLYVAQDVRLWRLQWNKLRGVAELKLACCNTVLSYFIPTVLLE